MSGRRSWIRRGALAASVPALLVACGPNYETPVWTGTLCQGVVASLPGVSDGRSAASADHVRYAETRSLIQCADLGEWLDAASRPVDPPTEEELLAYLDELCSRPENTRTAVCLDREDISRG